MHVYMQEINHDTNRMKEWTKKEKHDLFGQMEKHAQELELKT